MKFILKNKDEPLIKFDLRENVFGDYEFNIENIYNSKMLPTELERNPNNILNWLRKRNIPKNREFVNEILNSLDLKGNDLIGILNLGMSLSLNDTYWVVKEDFKGTFKDYNLYENDFNKTIALIAYTGHGQSNSLGTLPELTTGGTLKKAWRNKNNGIFLYKGGRKGYSNVGNEPFSEYYASQIANTMKLNCVNYDLEKWEGELASTCKLFTSIDIGYETIHSQLINKNSLEEIINIYKELGDEAYQEFCSMMVFDAVIYNVDRHLGNFGLLKNNNTNELISPAPIFDNGISLLVEAHDEDFKNLNSMIEYCSKLTPAIGKSFENNVAIFKGPLQQKQLSKLINFKFKKHNLYNYPDKKLELLEDLIQHRVKELLNIRQLEFKKNEEKREFSYDELPELLKMKAKEEVLDFLYEDFIFDENNDKVLDNFIFTIDNNIISLIEKEPTDKFLSDHNIDFKFTFDKER